MTSKNRSRRKEDRRWSVTPRWVNKVMTVCKYFLYVVPFLSCSVAMWLEGSDTLLSQSYVLTAVWCLSLMKLVDLIDDK